MAEQKGCGHSHPEGQYTSLTQEPLKTCSPTITARPSLGLLEILKNKEYTDVTFLVEEEVYPAHRAVVASQCAYFKGLLFGGLKEASSDVITLEDTPASAFGALLKYLYSGNVGDTDVQTALDLLCLADRYQLSELQSSLETSLCHNHLRINTVLQFLFYAEAYNCTMLQEQCMQFISCNTHGILSSEVILYLPYQHFKSFISRDQLLVDELVVLDVVKKWIAQNNPGLHETRKLLECVRLTEIPLKELNETVAASGLFESAAVSKAIDIQSGPVVKQGTMPRGTVSQWNLFDDLATHIDDFTNFDQKLHHSRKTRKRQHSRHEFNEYYAKWFPSDYVFRLLSRATWNLSYITCTFSDVFVINQLKFVGYSDDWTEDGQLKEVKEPFAYKVEVSRDEKTWTTVVDYDKYKCYRTQQLYFPKQAAKYLRLTVLRAHEKLRIRLLSCSSFVDPPYQFSNGVLAPMTALSPTFIRHVTDILTGIRLFITLHQPYSISSLKLRLCGLEGNGHVTVSVSTVNTTAQYKMVADLTNHDFSLLIQTSFPEKVVSIISIDVMEYKIDGKYLSIRSGITVEDVSIQYCANIQAPV